MTLRRTCKLRLQWTLAAAALFAIEIGAVGCSDADQGTGSTSGGAAQTSAGASGAPSGAGRSAAGSPAAASPAAGSSAAGRSAASSGNAGGAEAAANGGRGGGSADAGGFAHMGVCGQRGRSTVDASRFEGYEEFYIIADRGFGDDICVVRFDVKRVGDAPAGCDDPTADVDCLWTHSIEYSNPQIMIDVDGVCAKSQRKLDAAEIDAIDGSRAAYGFVSEFAGHNSVLMKYDDAKMMWNAQGNATWDESASALRFDRRDGICGY